MSSEWMKNMAGVTLSDKQMENIPRPRFEIIVHGTTKWTEAFGLLGSLVVAPINAYVKKETKQWPIVKQKITRIGRNGVLIGLVFGPLITYIKTSTEDDYKVWDRCYRIRNNRNQVRVDRNTYVSAAGGAAIGAVTGSGALFGGLVGMNTGLLVTALYNNVVLKVFK